MATKPLLEREANGALPETHAERRARIAYERALLDEARADIAAGRVIGGEEAEAILAAFERGEPLAIQAAAQHVVDRRRSADQRFQRL
jgi:hypothetical protein